MDELDRKVANLGKKKGLEGAKNFMNALAKDQAFVNALETDVGGIVLGFLVDLAETQMSDFINLESPSCSNCKLLAVKLELEATLKLISSIVKRINKHSERSATFNSL